MKRIHSFAQNAKLTLLALLAGLALVSHTQTAAACQNGDTSKTLLVLHETDGGYEDAVVGEVDASTQTLSHLLDGYSLSKRSADSIEITEYGQTRFTFDMTAAVQTKRFCFPIVYGTRIQE